MKPRARLSLPSGATTTWIWAWAGAGLGGLLALGFWAPAHWLAAAGSQASQSQVTLLNPRGTVWDGTAQLALTGGSGSSDTVALPGRVEWKIRPAWGKLHLHVLATCCTPEPLQLEVQARGLRAATLTLADQQSTWPSSLLVGLGTPWNTLQLQGKLQLRTTGLSLDLNPETAALAGRVQLDATQVSSRLSTIKPMGSYRLSVLGGTTPSLRLETLEGSLELSGAGQWVNSRLRFEGIATAQADRIEALSNLLNIIGRRNGAQSVIQLGSR
ncbi:MAG: general secretion pathway protein GspN [Burkholderiales bacterium PBB3]|nr:MAG: general secretion pathway protein GspN [Burkholderiales bacterium PBB3]